MRVYVCTVNCTVFCPEQDTRRLMSACSECLLIGLASRVAFTASHALGFGIVVIRPFQVWLAAILIYPKVITFMREVLEKRDRRCHRLGLNGQLTTMAFKAHILLDEKQPSLAISDRVVFPDALNDCLARCLPVTG